MISYYAFITKYNKKIENKIIYKIAKETYTIKK